VRPQDIVGAIANESGIPGRSIGAIDILDTYTFVDIPSDFVQRVLGAMTQTRIKGRAINIEVAAPGAGRQSREDRGPRHDGGGPRFRRDRDRPRDGGYRHAGTSGGPRRFDRDQGPPRFRVRRQEHG
jgi:ATP-dependent RNA helicase DeaD